MTQQPHTHDEQAFNKLLATIRIANEWCFHHVQQFLGSIHLSHTLQMCKRSTGGRVQASVLLWNLLACWNDSETAVYFAISNPDLSLSSISVKPLNGNFCKLGRAGSLRKKMEFSSQVVSRTYSILFSAKFGPFSNPLRGRPSAVHDERAG